jgi:hypothetical protein
MLHQRMQDESTRAHNNTKMFSDLISSSIIGRNKRSRGSSTFTHITKSEDDRGDYNDIMALLTMLQQQMQEDRKQSYQRAENDNIRAHENTEMLINLASALIGSNKRSCGSNTLTISEDDEEDNVVSKRLRITDDDDVNSTTSLRYSADQDASVTEKEIATAKIIEYNESLLKENEVLNKRIDKQEDIIDHLENYRDIDRENHQTKVDELQEKHEADVAGLKEEHSLNF